MRGFHCIGGGSVPPPPELPDAGPSNALKGTSPGLDGGADPSFVSYFVNKTLKSVNVCLECLVSMHWGWQYAAPNHLPDAGSGGAPKGASPGLGGGANVKFLCCIVLAKC